MEVRWRRGAAKDDGDWVPHGDLSSEFLLVVLFSPREWPNTGVRAQRGSGMSILGGIWDWNGHSSGLTALSLLRQCSGAGPDASMSPAQSQLLSLAGGTPLRGDGGAR